MEYVMLFGYAKYYVSRHVPIFFLLLSLRLLKTNCHVQNRQFEDYAKDICIRVKTKFKIVELLCLNALKM